MRNNIIQFIAGLLILILALIAYHQKDLCDIVHQKNENKVVLRFRESVNTQNVSTQKVLAEKRAFPSGSPFVLEKFDHERVAFNKIKFDVTNRKADQSSKICPRTLQNMRGKLIVWPDYSTPPTWTQIATRNPNVIRGGNFSPTNCTARYRVAFIIPFRDRESQLRSLLNHMHPVWQRQQLEYDVYVVNQVTSEAMFNKAKLMNIGFLEAKKVQNYDCYVFHDVDMLVENDKCLYRCSFDQPRELAVYQDRNSYREHIYTSACFKNDIMIEYFGGVTMFTEEQFYEVNGFSNLYWGWGAEDDDMYIRLTVKGYKVSKPSKRECTFHSMKHPHDAGSPINPIRDVLLRHTARRMKYEGLNTLRYSVHSLEKLQTFTNITVYVGQPDDEMTSFMQTKFSSHQELCEAIMPWDRKIIARKLVV